MDQFCITEGDAGIILYTYKPQIYHHQNDIFVVVMREKIRKWLGITELECELNKLKNEKLVIMETINKIRNDVELLKKELTEIDACKVNISNVNDRLIQIETKLNELECFQYSLDVVDVENNEEDIENTILNIIRNEKDVCISDLLSYTNLNTRKLYDILDTLENSQKIKRKRKGKKVIIECMQ